MLESEKKHIKEYGELKFHKALIIANMTVREDARFVGLDKIRGQIAFQAALQATGYPYRALKISKDCGDMFEAVQRAADDVFAKAIAAAKP